MKRVVLVGLLCLVACRDRGRDAKRAPEGSAGTAAGAGSGSAGEGAAPEMPASYARLVGQKPGTLGSALATLKLGAPVEADAVPELPATAFGFLGETEPRIVRRSPEGTEPKVLVNLEIRAGTLFAFRNELYTAKGTIPEDRCAGFVRALEARWGTSPDRVWVDRAAHVRAAFRDTCVLTFERYADVARWIGPEPTSVVPVAAVGKPASELAPRVGPGVTLDENVTFREVGVGEHATGPTTIDVYLHKGKVLGLGVEAAAAPADRSAIRDRISAAFAAQSARDATTGYDVWPTKPAIRMLETQTGVRVEVGKLTP